MGSSPLSLSVNIPTKILKQFHASGKCLICDGGRDLQDLSSCAFRFIDEDVSFSDMLLRCYNIEIQCENKSVSSELCKDCIVKLKDAYIFRKKIEQIGHNFKTLIYKYVNENKIIMDFPVRNSKSEDDEPLSKLCLMNKINNDVIERLKRADAVSYHNCSIKRIRLLKYKKYGIKKKNMKSKQNNRKMYNEMKNNNLKSNENFDNLNVLLNDDISRNLDNISCSSVESDDIDLATGFYKQAETKNKKIFLIPELQYSATSCPLCGMVPNTRQSLLRHYYDTHFPSFLCHLCGFGTTVRENFSSHMKSHKGVKYPCSSCTRIFTSPISRYHHQKRTHRNIPLFKCSRCDSTFSHSVHRRKHMFEKHGVECRTHPCAECGKIFYSEYRLSVHVKRSHLLHRPFPCSQCSQSFFLKCELRDHMTKHTGAKDFHCKECNKCFARRSCLTEHLKIHNNVRNFMCHLCHKTFVQKVSLNAHIKTRHKQCTVADNNKEQCVA